MRIALEVWSARFDQVLATCRRAESLGIDALYYGESPHGLNLDCWTTLAGLAASTEHIRLGPVITNILPSYRSLLLLAKQAATVAAIAGTRVDLRTGAGAAAPAARRWWEPYGVEYPDYGRRLDDLETALSELPRLWTSLGGDGAPLPVTVAARGARAVALAARWADRWETSFCTPAEFTEQFERMRRLTGHQRRLPTSLEIDGFVALDGGNVDKLLSRVREERAGEDLDRVFERALIGTPDDAAQKMAELADCGVDQLLIALHDPHDGEALEAVAEAARLARRRG